MIPEYLSSKGHQCFTKSAYDKDETVRGVRYLGLRSPSPSVDVVILNRNMVNADILRQIEPGTSVVWWLHDIVDYRYLPDGAFKSVRNVVSLSRYCTDTYSEFYGIDKARFTEIPNGIDPDIWHPGPYSERDKNLFVFASAPIKGYRALAFAMYNLRRRLPDLDFRVYSSQQLHCLEDDAAVKSWLAEMGASGAKISPPLPQRDLANVFRKAWALLMPNEYPEICSNLILQAQACGLPVVTSPIGSAAEFVESGDTGLLTNRLPHDRHMWWSDFARKTLDLATQPDLHRRISERSAKDMRTWSQIGAQWGGYLESIESSKAELIGLR